MRYTILPKILKREGPTFYRIDKKWQPKDLLPDPYRRNLLKDALARYDRLVEAEDEMQSLLRAHLYIGTLKRMRLVLKKAQFAWRFDDLVFLSSIIEFLKDYGTLIQYLKWDEARGSFDQE